MAAQQKFNLTFDVDANIKPMKQALSQLQSDFQNLNLSNAIGKGFSEAMNKVNKELQNFENLTSRGFQNLNDIKAAEKSFDKLRTLFAGLTNEANNLRGVDSSKLIPKDLAAQIDSVRKAWSSVNKILKQTDSSGIKEADKQLKNMSKDAQAAQNKIASLKETNAKLENKNERTRGLKAKREADLTKAEAQLGTLDVNSDAYKAKAQQVEELKTKIKEYNKILNDNTTAIADNNKAILQTEAAYPKQIAAIDELKKSLEKMRKEAANPKELDTLRRQVAELTGVSLRSVPKDMEGINRAIDTYANKLATEAVPNTNQFANSASNLSPQLENCGVQLNQTAQAATRMAQSMQTMDEMGNRVQGLFKWSSGLMLMRRTIRSAINEIQELDKIMTEAAVVTDFTVSDMWGQLPEYTKRAKELGLATSEVYESMTLFYQQGLDTNTVVELSNQTLKMARIAGLDAADATDRMTNALRGFNMALNEDNAQRIADVYSELAANTASNVDEISIAMSKVASLASNAGMEFETTAAFLSQIIETTRESAETAGTALKTVVARFQELKKAPEEMGEIDGEVVDANKIETALKSVGVALRDTTGQFRDLDDVFLELAQKWDSLDTNTQRYIATMAAGSRQQSRFIAMMSDYERTMELVQYANNSAGASAEQYEKTLDSLESKLAKLKDSWNEFIMNLMNSDLVKGLIDFGSGFLELINKLTSGFGLLNKESGQLGRSILSWAFALSTYFGGKKFATMITNNLRNALGNTVIFKNAGLKSGQALLNGLRTAFSSKQAETMSGTLAGSIGESMARVNKITKDFTKATNLSTDAINLRTKTLASELVTLGKVGDATGILSAEESEYVASKIVSNQISVGTLSLMTSEELKNYAVAASNYAKTKSEADATKMQEIANAANARGNLIGKSMIATKLAEGVAWIASSLGVKQDTVEKIKNYIITNQIYIVIIAIIAVLVILFKIIQAIVKAIKNNTAEAKLEQAKQQASELADAAQRAADAYSDLKDSIASIADEQDALDHMVEGTQEWTEALIEANQSIIELLDKYPELAKFITNNNGRLTIDFENPEVKDIIASYADAATTAQNGAMAAKMAVTKAESDVAQTDYFSNNKKYKVQSSYYDSETGYATNITDRNITNVLAKAIASGDLAPDQNGEYTKKDILSYLQQQGYDTTNLVLETLTEQQKDDLYELGKDLLDYQAEQNGYIATMALNAANGAIDDTDTAEQIAYKTTAANSVWAAMGDEITDTYAEMSKKDLFQAYATQVYGVGATANRKGEITYMDGTTEKTVTVSKDAALSYLNTMDQTEKTMAALDDLAIAITDSNNTILQRMFQSADGSTLTKADLDNINSIGVNQFAENAYTSDIAAIYDLDEWTKMISDAYEKANKLRMDARNDTAGTGAGKDYYSGKSGQEMLDDNTNLEGRKNLLNEIVDSTEAMRANYDDVTRAVQKNSAAIKENDTLLKAHTKDLSYNQSKITDVCNAAKEYTDAIGSNTEAAELEQLITYAQSVWGDGITREFVVANIQFFKDLGDEDVAVAQEAYNKIQAAVFKSAMSGGNEAFNELAADFLDKGMVLSSIISDMEAQIKLTGSFDATAIVTSIAELYGYGTEKFTEMLNMLEQMTGFTITADGFSGVTGTADWLEANGYTYDSTKPIMQDGKTVYNGIKKGTAVVTKTTTSSYDFGKDTKNQETYDPNYDKFYNQVAKLNKMLQERNSLEAEYNYLQTMGKLTAEDAIELRKKELDALKEEYKQNKLLAAQRTAYAQSLYDANKKKYGKYVSYDSNTNMITLNIEGIEKLKGGNAEFGEGLDNFISQLEEQKDAIDELNETVEDTRQTIADKFADDKDTTKEFVKRVEDAIEKLRTDEIDKLENLYDSINNANSSILSDIRDSVEKTRNARERAETQSDLQDLRSQLAYLSLDTSGSNILKIKELEENLKDQEQSYIDSLIDDALDEMEDANDRAERQRDDQITLMREQLDQDKESGNLAQEAWNTVMNAVSNNKLMTEDTALMTLLNSAEGWSTMYNELETLDNETELNNVAGAVENIYSWLLNKKAEEENPGNPENPTDPYEISQLTTTDLDIVAPSPSEPEKTPITPAVTSYKVQDENGKVVATFSTEDEANQYINNEKIKYNSQLSNAGRGKQSLEYYADYDEDAALEEYIKQNRTKIMLNVLKNSDFLRETSGLGDTPDDADEYYRLIEKYIAIEGEAMAANILAGNKNNAERYQSAVQAFDEASTMLENLKKYKVKKYATGGLVTQTGPAWLDGTTSKPEMVLNASDTQNFIQLKDILNEWLKSNNLNGNQNSGDNYFNIDINVDEIGSDYDVEQLKQKIEDEITLDAMYRNVNAVSLLR